MYFLQPYVISYHNVNREIKLVNISTRLPCYVVLHLKSFCMNQLSNSCQVLDPPPQPPFQCDRRKK